MKRISRWANENKIRARCLVVIIKCTLALLACYVGEELLKKQIHIPIVISGIIATISILAAIFYPSNKNRYSALPLYVRQKSCHFILAACTFGIIVTMVNNRNSVPWLLSTSFASLIKKDPPKAEEIIASLKFRDKSSLTRLEKRILKKEFSKQLKIYAVAGVTNDKRKADGSLEIILVIIGAIGLTSILSALVCSLSCSGADVAAAIVGVLGLAAIVWGAVVLIKHINRKSGNRKTLASN